MRLRRLGGLRGRLPSRWRLRLLRRLACLLLLLQWRWLACLLLLPLLLWHRSRRRHVRII